MFIIDFDDTLFDTHASKQHRLSAVMNCGVTKKDFHDTYAEIMQSEVDVYTNELHAARLEQKGYSAKKILEAFEEEMKNLHTYLFEDAIFFLQEIRQCGKPVYLLSKGDEAFQAKKIDASGVSVYFDRVIVTGADKVTPTKELIDGYADPIWFINDKVSESKSIEGLQKNIRIVMKKSAEFSEEMYKDAGFPYFYTLSEIAIYVKANQ